MAITRWMLNSFGNVGDLLTQQSTIKGIAATAAALPSTGNTTGDNWITLNNRHTNQWSGSAWSDLGLSLVAEIDLRTLAPADVCSVYGIT